MRTFFLIICCSLLSGTLNAQTPKNWRDYADQALARLLVKDTASAVKGFTAMVHGSGDSAAAYMQRGLFYVSIKQYDSAARDFATAIQKEPANTELYLARGVMYFERKQYMEAIKDFNECIVLNSDYAEAYYLHGLAALRMNDAGAAAMDFADVVRLDSTNLEAHYQLALIAIKQQRPSDALVLLNTVLRLNPTYAQAYMIRAATLIDMGKANEACPDLAEAVKLSYKPAFELLRTQCGKYLSAKDFDSLQTYIIGEVTVVGERDDYTRAAEEMKIIAKRCKAIASTLANRVTGRFTAARGTRVQGLFGTKADTKPLIVGSGGLPFTTIEQLETEAGGRLNLDDFIALTAARVAICKNATAQKTMSAIIQRRNYLRSLLDGNLTAEARGVIQEIAAEVNAVAVILNKDRAAQVKE